MDKPKPNKLAQFYSGQIQPNGALSLRRSVQFWSGVDMIPRHTRINNVSHFWNVGEIFNLNI